MLIVTAFVYYDEVTLAKLLKFEVSKYYYYWMRHLTTNPVPFIKGVPSRPTKSWMICIVEVFIFGLALSVFFSVIVNDNHKGFHALVNSETHR